MRAFLAHRDSAARASRRLHQAKEWVDKQSSTKIGYWKDLRVAEAERREQATVVIQTLFRGWDGRHIVAERRASREAAICIQRRYRGVKGRNQAREERWRRLQVVPTPYSLKLLMKRSREVRRADSWTEYFDPDTSAFWYFDTSTKRTTWDAPEAFLDSMTCVWDPWPIPYSSPFDKPCRKVFTNMAEFQSHRLHAHMWQCGACGQQNSSISFPRCELCGNTAGPDGEDLENVIEKAVREALWGMRNPQAENASNDGETFETDGTSQYEDANGLGFDDGSSSVTERSPRQISGEGGKGGEEMQELQPPQHGGGNFTRAISEGISGRFPGGSKGTKAGPMRRKDVQMGVLGGALRGVASDCDSSITMSSLASDSAGSMLLRVCHRFTQGTCSITTCPLAHPGVLGTLSRWFRSVKSRQIKLEKGRDRRELTLLDPSFCRREI